MLRSAPESVPGTAISNPTVANSSGSNSTVPKPAAESTPSQSRARAVETSTAPIPLATAVQQRAASASPDALAIAGARLARAGLPLTPATMAIALRATDVQLPVVGRWLPPAWVAAVDPAGRTPVDAMRDVLRLAGVVPAAVADPQQTLLQHLIRLAVRVGEATTPSTSATLPSQSANDPPLSRPVPAAGEPTLAAPGRELASEDAPSAGSTPSSAVAPPVHEPALAAVHEVAVDHLLPPVHLDDYERVIPLPMMNAGLPVPARLAVTTRRTASGGTACWMRVDCALSQLGAVSVRLSATDGGPVAVTLIAAPAAAAVLAAALPALTDDLHAQGVVAALRVVAADAEAVI